MMRECKVRCKYSCAILISVCEHRLYLVLLFIYCKWMSLLLTGSVSLRVDSPNNWILLIFKLASDGHNVSTQCFYLSIRQTNKLLTKRLLLKSLKRAFYTIINSASKWVGCFFYGFDDFTIIQKCWKMV